MNDLVAVLLLGVGATAVMDASLLVVSRATGLAFPDYALVGRWIAHMKTGRWRHASIARASPMPHEAALGWIAHYAIGIGFAAALVAVYGIGWLHQPTLAPALTVGLCSLAAPFLVMQPAMGHGLAARRAPSPWTARARSLLNHAVFGLGLYLAGRALATGF